jgi:hypothetical protein
MGEDDGLPILYFRAEYTREQYPAALEALLLASVDGRAIDGSPVYGSGLRYMDECCGEVWRVWPVPLWRGGGDCEDLAAARASELLCAGHLGTRIELRATAELGDGARLWHVLVRLPDGRSEDPSARLGMGRDASCDPLGPHGRPCPQPLMVR